MNCIRLFKHWGGILWFALFFVYALEAQNTEVPAIIQDLDASVELAVFRKIVPEDREMRRGPLEHVCRHIVAR